MNLVNYLTESASKLSNEQLICALECTQQCALLTTRTRREAALLRARCLRLEIERRRLGECTTVAMPSPAAASS